MYIPGPRGTTLDAVGVSLWVEHIPLPLDPTVRIAAVALYVEKNEGRRRLRAFKSRDAEAPVEPALKEALVNGGMGEALRYVVAGTPPGDVMMSGWIKSLKAKMKAGCPGEDADKLAAAFKGFFAHAFRKGDDFTFERRPGEELYAHYAGKPPTLVSSNACLGRALLVRLFFPRFIASVLTPPPQGGCAGRARQGRRQPAQGPVAGRFLTGYDNGDDGGVNKVRDNKSSITTTRATATCHVRACAEAPPRPSLPVCARALACVRRNPRPSALAVHGLTQTGELVGEALELRERVAQQGRELVGEQLLRDERAVVRNGVQRHGLLLGHQAVVVVVVCAAAAAAGWLGSVGWLGGVHPLARMCSRVRS